MNIKKCTCLFLAFLLLVSNVGLAFNVHYCGDKIAAVSLQASFVSQNSEKNCCGIVQKKSSCCKDKIVHFQKKSDNLILKSFSNHSNFIFLVEEWSPISFFAIQNFESNQNNSYSFDANAPPLFKLYHKYIFYA